MTGKVLADRCHAGATHTIRIQADASSQTACVADAEAAITDDLADLSRSRSSTGAKLKSTPSARNSDAISQAMDSQARRARAGSCAWSRPNDRRAAGVSDPDENAARGRLPDRRRSADAVRAGHGSPP
jgi:hypothetical protein